MSKMIELLLVDDDEMTLFIHKKIINRSEINFPEQSFNSAEMCLDYIRKEQDEGKTFIILLDINMPGMSGWDMLDQLTSSQLRSNYLVIMATSSVDSNDRTKAEKYPCVIDFIEKPLTFEACKTLLALPAISSLS